MSQKVTQAEMRLLNLLADIRAAVGDPEGKLMQDELVEHCKALRDDRDRLDRELRKANGQTESAEKTARLLRAERDRLREEIRAASEMAVTVPLAGSGQRLKFDSSCG